MNRAEMLGQDRVLFDPLGEPLAHEFLAVRRAEWQDLGTLPVEQEITAYFRRY